MHYERIHKLNETEHASAEVSQEGQSLERLPGSPVVILSERSDLHELRGKDAAEKPEIINVDSMHTTPGTNRTESIVAETGDELPEVYFNDFQDTALGAELALPLDLDKEVDEFWQEQEIFVDEIDTAEAPSTESLVGFTSEFSLEEAADIDNILNFDTEGNYEETKKLDTSADKQEVVNPELDYIEKVYSYIEGSVNPEKVSEFVMQLEVIQELAANLAIMEIEENIDETELEVLKQELLEQAEQLLALLGKASEQRIVRRFVEQVVIAKVDEIIADQVDLEDEGTHERKPVLSQLLDDIKNSSIDKKQLILPILGRFALT